VELIFWLSLALLAYAHIGYPALIAARARLAPRPHRRGGEPTVSIVIVAHNEGARIGARIDNLRALDYPSDRLEIVVASDGSSDGTAERARAWEPDGVTVVAFETRRGKAAVLNDVVPKLRGKIVVMADARQTFDTAVLRALVAPFADPAVGAVSGELILTSGGATGVGEGVGFYWRYEKFIRRHESLADSTVGATGAIYAIRRALFSPVAVDTILDDVLIPMTIVRRGYRVLFEATARAYDRPAATAPEEFRRKVRTIAGTFQLFARNRWLLSPRDNRLWLQTVSHKGLRLLSPLLLAALAVSNVLLGDVPLYRLALGLQVAFYGAALVGALTRGTRLRIPFMSVPYVFCLLNWATTVAFLRFLAGRQRVTWDKAAG
jgi:cellulose synthase/poly-beta-1,6-N-acetylglucosamine synthase-like glycosyltransferase